MNWGVKIFVTLAIFIAVAVGTGIYMVSNDHDTLVEEDYYEKGITYDSEYDHKTNVETLDAKPEISIQGNLLIINFNQNSNKGTIDLQRPSDSSLDKRFPFSINEKSYSLPIESLTSGKWKVLINWEHNGTAFLHEKIIFIP